MLKTGACCWFKELTGQSPYWESKMVEIIQMEIKLPGQPTFSWLLLWWDSWNNPGECLHPQCSLWGCPDTEQQWSKQTLCVRVVQNIRRNFNLMSDAVKWSYLSKFIHIHFLPALYLICKNGANVVSSRHTWTCWICLCLSQTCASCWSSEHGPCTSPAASESWGPEWVPCCSERGPIAVLRCSQPSELSGTE